MGLPPPSVAFDVSHALSALDVAVDEVASTLAGAAGGLRHDWQGRAADAAATLLAGLLAGAGEAGAALRQAAGTWEHLGHDLTSVYRKIEAVDAANDAANGFALASLLQLGLDPLSDAAAVGARAGAAAALAAARTMLRSAIERAVSRVAVDRAVLVATRIIGLYAVKSVAVGGLEQGFTEQFEYGSIAWARLADPAHLAADLVPRKAAALLAAAHTDLALAAPVPRSFPDRASYDQARTVAADWSARSLRGTQVTLADGPDGSARLTIHGASAPLTPGRAYSAAEVEALDLDLAHALDQVGVYADAPVTVVAER